MFLNVKLNLNFSIPHFWIWGLLTYRTTETQKPRKTVWQNDRKTDKKRKRRNNKQMEREKEWMTTRQNLKLASHWSIFVISIYWVLNKLCNKCLHQLHEIIFNKWHNGWSPKFLSKCVIWALSGILWSKNTKRKRAGEASFPKHSYSARIYQAGSTHCFLWFMV